MNTNQQKDFVVAAVRAKFEQAEKELAAIRYPGVVVTIPLFSGWQLDEDQFRRVSEAAEAVISGWEDKGPASWDPNFTELWAHGDVVVRVCSPLNLQVPSGPHAVNHARTIQDCLLACLGVQ